MSDLKELVEAQAKAFEEFKQANDQRLAEIEQKGHADPTLVEKVEKANADITDLKDKIEEARKLEQRLDEVEAVATRPAAGGGTDDIHDKARQFFTTVRGREVEDGEVDVDAYKAYRRSFSTYLRKGDRAASPEIMNALSVGSDPDGGYFVDPDTGGRIAQLIYETSPVRQVANVVTIGTDALEGVNDLDEAGQGWVGETESRSETSTPQVGEWRIPVFEQYAEPRATQKLLDDAMFDIEGWLQDKVANKLAREENKAFVNGDGVKKPRGFLTYSAGTPDSSNWDQIEQVNSGASGDFAGSNPGDPLIDLVFKVKNAYRQGATWAMNRATLGEVRKLKDGDGNYLWQPDFGQMATGTLIGFPITEMEDMPDMASDSLSIAFGNFNAAYQIVDRQGIRVLRDPFTSKPYVKFYTTKRVGGGVVNFEAIKLMKFAS